MVYVIICLLLSACSQVITLSDDLILTEILFWTSLNKRTNTKTRTSAYLPKYLHLFTKKPFLFWQMFISDGGQTVRISLASNIPLFLSYAFPSSIVVVPSHRRKIPQQFMMPKLTKKLLLCAMFIKVEFKETFCVSYICNNFFCLFLQFFSI